VSQELNHQDIESLLGAYALDAVDPAEADAIELHLRECPQCRAEVAAHRETAAMLANSGTPAPPGVWDNIVAQLEASPPLLTLAKARPVKRWPTITSAAAAIVLLAGSVAWVVGRQSTPGTRPGGSPIDAAIIAAYADPHARSVRLNSSDGRHHVDAVVRQDGTGYLVRNNLPPLAAGRTYQLWGIVGRNKVSLGVLGRAPTRLAFIARMTKLDALAITDEEAGGVVASQQAPVVVGVVAS
jgi:anti-sigma-K factor RskA